MPLSDRDRRVLEDIERGLNATDPKLAACFLHDRPRSTRAIVLAISTVAVGLVLILFGMLVNVVLLSILGYVLMVGAIVRLPSRLRRAGGLSRLQHEDDKQF